MKSNGLQMLRREGWGWLALFLPCLIFVATLLKVYQPGLTQLAALQAERDQMAANVYQTAWLDSAELDLRHQVALQAQNLQRAQSRLLPRRPFQQTLDSLRHCASKSGVEVLETQVSTSRQDSLRAMQVRLRARGSYANLWAFFKRMEKDQPWWTLTETSIRPASEAGSQLDALLQLVALGSNEVLK